MKNLLYVILILCALFTSCIDPNTIISTQDQFMLSGMDYDDSSASIIIGAAAVCLEVNPEDPSINRNNMTSIVDTIISDHPDTRLIVFGETSLGYYYRPSNPEQYQRSIAETIPGPTTNALAAKAIEHNVYVSAGLTEIADALYNSQVLINPSGVIESVHRKTFLTDWDMEDGFTAGEGVTFNNIDGIKTATIICFDSMSEKVYKEIGEEKPQLIILSVADTADEQFVHYDSVSFMTNAWVVAANRFGNEDGNQYDGHHWISTPAGSYRVKSTGRAGYVYTEVRICN